MARRQYLQRTVAEWQTTWRGSCDRPKQRGEEGDVEQWQFGGVG